MHSSDFQYGGYGGRNTVDGPVRVDQYQTGVGRELVQGHVQAEMFFYHPLAPGSVHRPEYGGGHVRIKRVGQSLGQVHALRQAAERGRPVRGVERLADHRHRPRQ